MNGHQNMGTTPSHTNHQQISRTNNAQSREEVLSCAADTTCPVTVIIPAYNAASTIKRAIESILSQVDSEAQIIIVNDGSTDNTVTLVEELAARHPKSIQLVNHDKNKGMLEARRTGIHHVVTPFVAFLDADDTYEPTALATMLQAQAQGDYDIVQCSVRIQYANYVPADEKRFTEEFCNVPNCDAYDDDITHLIFRDRRTTWTLWAKLMRSSLVREAYDILPHDYVNLAEDVCAFFVISCLAHSYHGMGSFNGYVYNIDEGSSGALKESLDLEQFEYNCKIMRPLEIVRDYLRDTGRWNTPAVSENPTQVLTSLAPDYLVVRHEMVRAVADKLLHKVKPSVRPAAYDIFARTFPAEEAVSALAEVSWFNPADAFESIASATALQCPARPSGIRTVGVYNFRMGLGGAERISADLAQLWHTMGYHVVFLADCARDECDYDLTPDIEWVQLPATDSIVQDGYIVRAEAIAQAVRDYHIDAIVHHQWYNTLLAWDMLLLKTLHVPVCVFVHSFHGVLFSVGNTDEFDVSRILRYADALVVLSASDVEFWHAFNPRVYLTNNPSPLKPGTQKRAPLTGHDVVWVGRLTPFDKRPSEAIEIMAQVCAEVPDARLIMVGPPRWESELKELQLLAKRYGIASNVVFTGAQDDVAPFLQNASVYLMTSVFEGYPLSLAESKAVGLPCVMYELPYLTLATSVETDDAKDSGTGIIAVPQGDHKAAADAIVRLLLDVPMRATLGEDAYRHLCKLEQFDYKALWREIFNSLAEGSIVRAGFEQADQQWNLLLDSLKNAMNMPAPEPSLYQVIRHKGGQLARRLYHTLKPE